MPFAPRSETTCAISSRRGAIPIPPAMKAKGSGPVDRQLESVSQRADKAYRRSRRKLRHEPRAAAHDPVEDFEIPLPGIYPAERKGAAQKRIGPLAYANHHELPAPGRARDLQANAAGAGISARKSSPG